MAIILCMETSTDVCSAALTDGGKLLFSEEEYSANSHASMLTVLVERMMKKAEMELKNIDAVAIGSGPGSYTGLRIGAATAKGICYALGKPLIAITSLHILAQQVCLMHPNLRSTLFCPMIDARRMEVYTTLFDSQLNQLDEIRAEVVTPESFVPQFASKSITFFGNGAAKCKEVIVHPNALFLDGVFPLASAMAEPAQSAFVLNRFEDVARFDPFYLKEFVATVPKRFGK